VQLDREICSGKIEISETGIIIYFLLSKYQRGPLLHKELPCVNYYAFTSDQIFIKCCLNFPSNVCWQFLRSRCPMNVHIYSFVCRRASRNVVINVFQAIGNTEIVNWIMKLLSWLHESAISARAIKNSKEKRKGTESGLRPVRKHSRCRIMATIYIRLFIDFVESKYTRPCVRRLWINFFLDYYALWLFRCILRMSSSNQTDYYDWLSLRCLKRYSNRDEFYYDQDPRL